MDKKKANLDEVPKRKRKSPPKRPRVSAKERERLIRLDEKKKTLERVNRVARRQQERNFNRFSRSAQFPKKKRFFSGLGVFKRTRRVRENIGDFSEQARKQFFGERNSKKVIKMLDKFSNISRVRLRRMGLAAGVLAVGALIARDPTGDPVRKRSVGRPRFKRSRGRSKSPNRVGRPRLSNRR